MKWDIGRGLWFGLNFDINQRVVEVSKVGNTFNGAFIRTGGEEKSMTVRVMPSYIRNTRRLIPDLHQLVYDGGVMTVVTLFGFV